MPHLAAAGVSASRIFKGLSDTLGGLCTTRSTLPGFPPQGGRAVSASWGLPLRRARRGLLAGEAPSSPAPSPLLVGPRRAGGCRRVPGNQAGGEAPGGKGPRAWGRTGRLEKAAFLSIQVSLSLVRRECQGQQGHLPGKGMASARHMKAGEAPRPRPPAGPGRVLSLCSPSPAKGTVLVGTGRQSVLQQLTPPPCIAADSSMVRRPSTEGRTCSPQAGPAEAAGTASVALLTSLSSHLASETPRMGVGHTTLRPPLPCSPQPQPPPQHQSPRPSPGGSRWLGSFPLPCPPHRQASFHSLTGNHRPSRLRNLRGHPVHRRRRAGRVSPIRHLQLMTTAYVYKRHKILGKQDHREHSSSRPRDPDINDYGIATSVASICRSQCREPRTHGRYRQQPVPLPAPTPRSAQHRLTAGCGRSEEEICGHPSNRHRCHFLQEIPTSGNRYSGTPASCDPVPCALEPSQVTESLLWPSLVCVLVHVGSEADGTWWTFTSDALSCGRLLWV